MCVCVCVCASVCARVCTRARVCKVYAKKGTFIRNPFKCTRQSNRLYVRACVRAGVCVCVRRTLTIVRYISCCTILLYRAVLLCCTRVYVPCTADCVYSAVLSTGTARTLYSDSKLPVSQLLTQAADGPIDRQTNKRPT